MEEKKNKQTPTKPDAESPEWSEEMFKAAKRIEDFPELAHLAKREPGDAKP
jgi:hypothetical protein